MARALDELFADALRRYPKARREEKFGRDSAFWPLIAELRAALEVVPVLAATTRTKVKVSFGQGAWAEVPNFAVLDTKETDRPSAGLYVVYLMRADAGGLVLSLNQGSADLIFEAKGRVYDVLRARAEKVRSALRLEPVLAAGFTDAPSDLASNAHSAHRDHQDRSIVIGAERRDAFTVCSSDSGPVWDRSRPSLRG